MSEESLEKNIFSKPQVYEIDVPIRGYRFDLGLVKRSYEELQALNDREGARILSNLKRGEDQSQEVLDAYKDRVSRIAFRITVSIVGGEDGTTRYGEDASVFKATDLPSPITTIFMTNETAFAREAGNSLPPNRFNVWIHFLKPPLADPNPLVSDPTQNPSRFIIKADDLTYFRAAQRILTVTLTKDRVWYAPIHNKFAYDIGLWCFFLPYSLYLLATKIPEWLPAPALTLAQFATFLFCLGVTQIIYRGLVGYMKWALPVNVLAENRDTSAVHRLFFGAILIGVLGNAVYTLATRVLP